MKSIDQFINAINNHEFVEAHEVLEHDWKNYKNLGLKKEAKALQGLINGATALALYLIKNRPDAYKKIWSVFKKYEHLLDEIEIEDIEKYHKAKNILIEKNQTLIRQK